MKRSLPIVITWLLVLSACSPLEISSPTPTPLSITPTYYPTETPVPIPDPLYLNITWQFHLPSTPVDAQTGLLSSPQARLRAINDYYSLAIALQQHPLVKSTISFSPLLLRDLGNITSGARDVYWELAARPTDSLSDENMKFIVDHFFEHDEQHVIAPFPRYQQLLQQRTAAQAFTAQDIRDLQVWYNLAAFSPDLLKQSPLFELVSKGRDFNEDDKRVLFDHTLAVMRQMNPLYSALQDNGQIELSASPYAQAILPLLLDTDVAHTLSDTMPLPNPPFKAAQDVSEQLKRAGVVYQQAYGRAPLGLLPTAGAIAPNVMPLISSSGYEWLVSGEDVLARALKLERFTRDDAGLVRDAEALYQPYQLTASQAQPLFGFFRDTVLSERIETAYGALGAQAAADDLLTRIQAIRMRFKASQSKGPHLVTLVIDGESALSSFSDRGHAFLQELFTRLTQAAENQEILTTTPIQYLEAFPPERSLAGLGTGSWGVQGTSDFSPFIGTRESNAAWTNLYRAREFLDSYLTGAKIADPTAISHAYEVMLQAESADWLDGHAYSSANRNDSDQHFRNLLGQVYMLVGAPLPVYLQVPLVQPVVISGELGLQGMLMPTVDGSAVEAEWTDAGVIRSSQGAQSPISAFYYGANRESIYFRLDALDDWATLARSDDTAGSLRVGVYLAKAASAPTSRFTRVGGDGEVRLALGMSATHLLEWSFEPDGTSATLLYSAKPGGWSGTATLFTPGAMSGKVLELSAPLKALGGLISGTSLTLTVAIIRNGQVLATYPLGGLAQMQVPGVAQPPVVVENALLSVIDPTGDDNGPGSYTYPTNGVFANGSYDLRRTDVMLKDGNLIFKVEINSAIDNAWNSPIGLSIQTLDIYIDKDPGKSTGERKLLEGRNASLPRKDGWEYALWVEGWAQELLTPDGKGSTLPVPAATVTVEIDPTGVVLIEVPLAVLGEGDPKTWGYAVVMLSQEAYPSEGVKRVRDVDAVASQWRIGGAPADTNHTRILDVLIPDGASQTQQALLSQYMPSVETDITSLPADEFGIVPLITIQP